MFSRPVRDNLGRLVFRLYFSFAARPSCVTDLLTYVDQNLKKHARLPLR